MKILILRFSSIGDIVLTTPVIRNLGQMQDSEVHYATKRAHAGLVEANPFVTKTHVLDSDLNLLISQLKKEKFDLIIDLHNNLRTKWIKFRLGTESKTVNKYNLQKWLLTNFKINKLPNNHIVDRYLETIIHLKPTLDHEGLDYFIPEKDEVELDWLPEPFRQGYIALAIGGQFATKRLPKSRLIELCDRINKPIVLLGDKQDALVGKEIEEFFTRSQSPNQYSEGLDELGKHAIVFNGCGKFNLNQAASLIKQSSFVFTHDTGLMHIAAAFKKQIFSTWGSTVPEFGMYPYMTKFTIFENKNLDCRPCSKIGFDKCPKGHFKCMNDVAFDFYLPD
ncbi:MAG: glycosyltransferase family 9 protein [Cyclobacteriaceae bacterium]